MTHDLSAKEKVFTIARVYSFEGDTLSVVRSTANGVKIAARQALVIAPTDTRRLTSIRECTHTCAHVSAQTSKAVRAARSVFMSWMIKLYSIVAPHKVKKVPIDMHHKRLPCCHSHETPPCAR